MAVYECYVDGGSRGQGKSKDNLGDGAAGFVIYKNRKEVAQYARLLGRCTNNQAEFEAILLGIQFCWAAGFKDPIIYSDSQAAVNMINGKYKCTNPNLIPLLISVQEIEAVFRFRVMNVPRKHVYVADNLVNRLLDDYQNRIGDEKQGKFDRRS